MRMTFTHHPLWHKSVLGVFYALLVLFTILFLMPTHYLPEESIFNWWDKAQHAAVFGVLTVFAILTYPDKVKALTLGLLLYGALIEILQSCTSWRQGDFSDWCADAIGVVIMYLLFSVLRAINKTCSIMRS